MVKQAARGGDNNLHAFFQGADLSAVGRAADQWYGEEPFQLAPVFAHLILHLQGEFARRGEDESARFFAALFALDEAGKDGQDEGGGFAAAGLRGELQVAPGDGKRDGLCLDGRRGGIAAGGDGVKQGFGEVEVAKGLHVVSDGLWQTVTTATPDGIRRLMVCRE